jgi:ribosome-associated protein
MAPSDDIDTDEFPDRPSRSARKREAEYLQKLGVRLLGLRPAELAALELPETLLDALAEARRLASRSALARQRQYIGRLMRDVDPAPLEAALERHARGGSGPRGTIR